MHSGSECRAAQADFDEWASRGQRIPGYGPKVWQMWDLYRSLAWPGQPLENCHWLYRQDRVSFEQQAFVDAIGKRFPDWDKREMSAAIVKRWAKAIHAERGFPPIPEPMQPRGEEPAGIGFTW